MSAAGGEGGGEVTIARAGIERLDDLRPLWESLHHHHVEVAPQLGPELGEVRPPGDSWAVRRDIYLERLATPDAFVMIAEAGSGPVGYALVHIRGPEESWATERVAELDTLAVLPGYRGAGLGSALVDAVHRELRRLGIAHIGVSVIASNTDAVRFYERRGLLPFTTYYIGRVPPDA